MQSFKITMKDNSHQGIYQLEAAIRNCQEWVDFWGPVNGQLSQAWANSRMLMFATQGASTGPKWPNYTQLESKYWVPIKKWSLGVKKIDKGGILRWAANPMMTAAQGKEVLWPSMCIPGAPGYVWDVTGNKVECGTSIPYAQNHDKGTGSWQMKVRASSVSRAQAKANRAVAQLNKAKSAGEVDRANARADRAIARLQDKQADFKRGTISVPTPKRPLVRFGDGFIDAVRDQMKSLAMMQASGAKVGITSNEFAVRYLMGRQGGTP
jgi:hypothetical protein